jgi:hypothetical protein
MYDALTTTYRLSCPRHGQTSVRLSRFRLVDELPGARHPALYRIVFACGCGDEHPGLVSHDELDWAPLGLEAGLTFLNLMTSRRDSVALELSDLAAQRIKAGEWPWSFFCWPEDRARPVYPSAFRLLVDSGRDSRIAVAVRCPGCGRVSVNIVSREHLDVPFHNDREIGVVPHLFAGDEAATIDSFRTELYSVGFDARRLALE